MLNKEECTYAYNKLCNEASIASYYNGKVMMEVCEAQFETFRNLIKEHFELVEHAKKLQDEVDKYKLRGES